MKKNLLIIFLLTFMFIPVLNAETYYDLEVIEVETLSAANEETLNKVYKVDNKYYITEKTNSEHTSFTPDYKGNTIVYLDFSTLYDDVISNNVKKDNNGNLSNGDWNGSATNLVWGDWLKYSYNDNFFTLYVSNKPLYIYDIQKSVISLNKKSYNFPSFGNQFNYWYTGYEFFDKYFSLTPFETTYSWKEVPKSDVIKNELPTEDFYLFFSFEDIKEFNILSSYNLESFNDFEKIVTVLLFNIFFSVFIGICIYLFIKLFNKGYSILTK